MVELLGKSKEELRALCMALGEPAYRGGQVYHALYAERTFEFARMTNLPVTVRERQIGHPRKFKCPLRVQSVVNLSAAISRFSQRHTERSQLIFRFSQQLDHAIPARFASLLILSS